VVHTCNSSYLGDEMGRSLVRGKPGQKVHETPFQTIVGHDGVHLAQLALEV
jgi:hypothetical protein